MKKHGEALAIKPVETPKSRKVSLAFPHYANDVEAKRFVDEADLSLYDFTQFRPLSHELERKTRQINLRMPENLLQRLKAEATRRNVPYQRLIREAVEKALG
jgi:predicted DNA binding CopG/RHH family protein